MIKEEIVSGLKQAIERGYSLEQAKQSFVNAGYNNRDISDSASSLGGIITSNPEISNIPQISQMSSVPNILPPEISSTPPQQTPPELSQIPPQPTQLPQETQTKSKTLVIILIVILILIVLGLAALFLFKDQILGLLNSIF